MALVRWQPFREIDTLQRQLDRIFNDDFLTRYMREDQNLMTLSAELSETPEALHLKLEIPGMESKDIDVQVTKDTVSVSGERKQETKTEENGNVRSEFRYGKFQRVISLPAHVQNDKVEAEYKDGILTLTLPKSEAEKNKIVKVSLN